MCLNTLAEMRTIRTRGRTIRIRFPDGTTSGRWGLSASRDSASAPDRVSVRTYSPSRKQYKTDGRSQFSFDFSFASRFGQPSSGSGGDSGSGGTTGTATFQQGSGGYAATQDTNLRESSPTTGYGSATTLVVDTDEPSKSGRKTHGLLRFDSIVGTGSGQIPAGSTVTSAKLSLQTVDPGNGASLHRMRTKWTESDT